MHKPLCIILLVVATPSVWTKTKWSKEIPDPELQLTRERRQFNLGDWIPLTQPCLTCRPLTDSADTGRIQDDIGLTPPRPPTVTRQIHKTSFFPQDESSILSVPPPPVFNRNQIPNANTRFQNIFQQFNNPNSLQLDAQPVFPQTQFLPQTFLGGSTLLGSNYPQVLPLLNNPSALLVQGNINAGQEIKTQKINHESKVPNLQDNVILEQNRQQQQHQQQQQPVAAPSPGLELPLTNEAVNFAPQRQQQNLIEGNILTPPPVPNSTIPDVIIPGLDKEEIQLLYVPLETLRQRSQQLEQQQKRVTQSPQNVEFGHQQQSLRPTERPTTSQPIGHFITYSATPATPTAGSSFQQFPVTPSTLFFQHLPFQGTQTPLISPTPETPTLQTFVTPSTLNHKFSSFPSITPTENLVTPPEKVQLNQEFLTTPKTLTDQLSVKDVLGKELNLEELHKINKLKTVSIPSREEQEKNFRLEQQKEQEKQKLLLEEQERERLKQQKLQREQQEVEEKQKLLREQQEREKQQKLLREQQERDRQQKLFREQQERERYQKLLREQKERERQQKLFREQQERERQEKLYREQQERERQEKLYREQQEKLLREQQERERQEKLYREQQERERQEKLYREQQEKLLREQQERERQEKLYREQQERERQEKLYREQQEKLLREQQERERQEKLYREQQERERQEKLYREQQEKLLREQQERERQEKLYREQQERERQEKLYREQQEKLIREQQEKEQQEKLLFEQQEKERQQKYIYEQQERERQQQLLFEQQERERQEKLILEEKRQKELLIKEQQDREQQLLLNQQQEFLLKQQIAQTLPSQFDFQSQTEATGTFYEQQTEAQDASLIPHQPPLSIFYGSSKPQPRIPDLLRELRNAKTIPVLDQYLEVIPKFFVGPADMNPPKGYGKFDLPYLSNIDVSRVERKVNKLPFFVAPLNFIPPNGYSKIPFPAPHVGSVVVSSETTSRQTDEGSTYSPYLSSVRSTPSPEVELGTQLPVTSHVQQISPKLRQKENRKPHELLSNPQLSTNFKTESVATTVTPETTTQARTRRPFYRTKVRRPTTAGALPVTRRPETAEGSQVQKTEITERKPSTKFPKRGRQRTKSTTENPESDSLNSANRQYLVETSPTDTVKTFESEILKNEYGQNGDGKEFVQGIFEVDNSEKRKFEQSGTDATTEAYASPQGAGSTLGFGISDNPGYSVTTASPSFSTSGAYEPGQRTVSTIGFDGSGKASYFPTPQPQPVSAERENVGHTGFYGQTPRIPVGIENNGDNGFYNKPTFTGTDVDFPYATVKNTEGQSAPDFISVYGRETSGTGYDSGDGGRIYKEKQPSADFSEGTEVESHEKTRDEVVSSTPKSGLYEANNHDNEQTTESVAEGGAFPFQKVKDDASQDTRDEEYQRGHTPGVVRIKSRIRSKSRGQVNYANSQTTTPNPLVRKRVAYKTRKESPTGSEGDEVRPVPKYRGQKKSYQTSTEAYGETERTRNSHTSKPHRRTGVSAIVRRRRPTTSLPETTSQASPQNYDIEYSPSGVSNEVLDDQIRESTQSRRQYSQNVITFTATTATELPTTTEIYGRRRDELAAEEEVTTKAEEEGVETVEELSRVVPTAAVREKDEEPKKHQETKKAFDPSLEKKNSRRRIRVRVHKRPHEHFEAAESQNLGTVANALAPPTSAKPSSEPDLYRLSKTGFNFDQSEKFAGTKNQAHVRNITSDILESTAAFSSPGTESDGDPKKVTIAAEERHAMTTTTTTTELATEATTLEPSGEEDGSEGNHVTGEEGTEETTTTEVGAEEASTLFGNAETETEALTTEEELTRETQMSTATEISHETEICFRGKCVKTNSATADDDLRKLVQSADKILKT